LFKSLAIFIVATCSIATIDAAAAQQKHAHHRQHQLNHAQIIICNRFGCSDRDHVSSIRNQALVDPNGNAVGGRPAGCPHAFCGCEASLYLFGEIRPYLNLASNWITKFPRTSPAPGMVAARNHHVMVLISHSGGNDWLVHDGNSGGGLTRNHVVSLSGYTIVDPQSARWAQRDQ
jgi:hypothetical protein